MKTKLIYAVTVAGALCVGSLLNSEKAAAAAAPGVDPGAPPIGKIVDITVIAWPLGTQPVLKINGTLVAMQSEWIVVNEGTYDHWIPTAKVMSMRVSK